MLSVMLTLLIGLPALQAPAAQVPQKKEINAAPAQAAGDREVKVIAKSPARLVPANGHVIIRSAAELVKAQGGKGDEQAATAALAKQLKTDIDWTKHMVLVLDGGTQRTGGYSVVVKNLTVKDNVLTVNWMLKGPGPNDIVTQVITRPSAVLLVERFGGEVHFDPAKAPGGVKGKLDRR
jgi:hypothetical protein